MAYAVQYCTDSLLRYGCSGNLNAVARDADGSRLPSRLSLMPPEALGAAHAECWRAGCC